MEYITPTADNEEDSNHLTTSSEIDAIADRSSNWIIPMVILPSIIMISCCIGILICCVVGRKQQSNQYFVDTTNVSISSMNSPPVPEQIQMVESVSDKSLRYGPDHEADESDVSFWLKSIGFSTYYELFISHGYETMDKVKEINNESVLEDIGISSEKDQIIIAHHVKLLKNGVEDIGSGAFGNVSATDGLIKGEVLMMDDVDNIDVDESPQNEREFSEGPKHHNQLKVIKKVSPDVNRLAAFNEDFVVDGDDDLGETLK